MPPLQWGRNLSCRGVLLRSRGFAFAKPLSPIRTALPEIRHFPAGGMNASPTMGAGTESIFGQPGAFSFEIGPPPANVSFKTPLVLLPFVSFGHIIAQGYLKSQSHLC